MPLICGGEGGFWLGGGWVGGGGGWSRDSKDTFDRL
jgi:hypothetical protein